MMDESRKDSGGKLEVESVYYLDLCVVAGFWHGQLLLPSTARAEPESWNGE